MNARQWSRWLHGHRGLSVVTAKVVSVNDDVAVYRLAGPGEEPDALFYPGPGGNPRRGVLEGSWPPRPRLVEEFYGGAVLARWRGVTPSALSKWFSRYGDQMPAEDARLRNDARTGYERYYRADREAEWRNLAPPGPGQGGTGTQKRRRPEAEERRQESVLDAREPDKRGMIHWRDVAGLLPLRASVPRGPRKTVRAALDAVPGRIVLSAADEPGTMWLWAADQSAAAAAAEAMPGLEFTPHD